MNIEEYKNVVLQVMVKLDKFCREHELRYMLAYGSLLGAVRHGGFIPWDDDMDILMPREDYDKLRELLRDNDLGLRFLDIETCPETIYSFGKVCDANTELWEDNFQTVPGMGAYVDIFPLDHLPADAASREKQRKYLRQLVRLIEHSSRVGYTKTNSPVTNLKRALAFYLTRCLNTQKLIRKLYRESVRYNDRDTGWQGLVWGTDEYRTEELEPYGTILFDGHAFMAPADPDAVLRRQYGDYMQLPPEEERVYKHSLNCCWIEDPEKMEARD